ncbi:hypothetical protein FB192DRAFT_1358860 [Mucor lusitanicus]|uniref:Uncharacterized protein n=1 Tax=Mucor circinelloides f. lusitanicus TaxID=29924 RepID=A0A8H4BM86_MUCCL|nr:hypothetical protein FB192DRAFT_1358860 [Mucor lusitanicus]
MIGIPSVDLSTKDYDKLTFRGGQINNKIAQSQQDFYPKVQPRSSAERDNSNLLHSALRAASTDMAHKLLDYASLDKTDCEASCILIALANHEPLGSRSNKTNESHGETSKPKQPDQDKMSQENLPSKQALQGVTQTNDKKSQQKSDPIMLLMAAAEVVNRQSHSDEKRKRYSYPSRYYHRTSDEWTPQHKRMRTSPPTSPAPTSYKPDTWRKNSSRSHSKSDHKSSTKVAQANNSFSKQYHSMKQNPKIKQNALHTYITYMIYNDLAHGGANQNGKPNAMTTSTLANGGAIEKNHQPNVFESVSNNSMPPSTTSVSPNYYKQSKQRNEHLHHRPYAGDALNNSPGSSSSMRSVSTTPADVNSHSQQLTTSSTTTANTSDSKSTISSLSSPWYPPANHSPLNARSSLAPSAAAAPPPPPTLHDERSILSRPLTAFLWDKEDKSSSIPAPKKDMMILPPLSSAKASPSPSNFDQLKPV